MKLLKRNVFWLGVLTAQVGDKFDVHEKVDAPGISKPYEGKITSIILVLPIDLVTSI